MTPLTPFEEEALTETTEKLVILYANLSGRESANRAAFRVEAEKLLLSLLRQQRESILKEVEELNENPSDRAFRNFWHGYKQAIEEVQSIIHNH